MLRIFGYTVEVAKTGRQAVGVEAAGISAYAHEHGEAGDGRRGHGQGHWRPGSTKEELNSGARAHRLMVMMNSSDIRTGCPSLMLRIGTGNPSACREAALGHCFWVAMMMV